MAEVCTEHCVEIRVPLDDREHQGFGSGYTVGPHWVLTAHHVLFPDGVDESQPLEITWWDESDNAIKDRKSVCRDDIVWFHQTHDIALLRCPSPYPYPEAPGAWVLIGRDRPKAGAPCHCAGYLSNLRNEAGGQRRKTPNGTLGGFSPGAVKTDINGLDVRLEDDDLWQGFSGSAVFSGNRLAAIVRAVNSGEAGGGLSVSFIAPALDAEGDKPGQGRLRDVSGFLGSPGSLACWKRMRSTVEAQFELQPGVFEAIRDCCRADLAPGVQIRDAIGLANALYYWLPEQKVIGYLLRTLTRMIQAQSTEGVQAVEYLARAWLSLLAAGEGTVQGIDAFKRNPSATPLSLEAVQPLLVDVESRAAEAEQREAQLQISGKHLRSPLDLTPEHNTGLDGDGRMAAGDTDEAYRLKTLPGMEAFRAEDAKEELEHFATRPVTGLSHPLAPGDDPARGRIISDQLIWDCAESGGSLYIRIPPLSHGGGATELRDLHQWCPELLILEVNPREDTERMNYLSGLNRIIHRAQEFLAANDPEDTSV